MFESMLDNDLIVISFQEVEMKGINFCISDSCLDSRKYWPCCCMKNYLQWDRFLDDIFDPEIFHRDSFVSGSTMMLFYYKKEVDKYIKSTEFTDLFLGTLNQIGNKAAIGLHVILL